MQSCCRLLCRLLPLYWRAFHSISAGYFIRRCGLPQIAKQVPKNYYYYFYSSAISIVALLHTDYSINYQYFQISLLQLLHCKDTLFFISAKVLQIFFSGVRTMLLMLIGMYGSIDLPLKFEIFPTFRDIFLEFSIPWHNIFHTLSY